MYNIYISKKNTYKKLLILDSLIIGGAKNKYDTTNIQNKNIVKDNITSTNNLNANNLNANNLNTNIEGENNRNANIEGENDKSANNRDANILQSSKICLKWEDYYLIKC